MECAAIFSIIVIIFVDFMLYHNTTNSLLCYCGDTPFAQVPIAGTIYCELPYCAIQVQFFLFLNYVLLRNREVRYRQSAQQEIAQKACPCNNRLLCLLVYFILRSVLLRDKIDYCRIFSCSYCTTTVFNYRIISQCIFALTVMQHKIHENKDDNKKTLLRIPYRPVNPL